MDLSIIIPNYNTKELTYGCISSIIEQTKKTTHEIIVVDNASSDGSASYFKKQFTPVRIIKNSDNLGFGKACNQASLIAKGRYICILNSDILLVQDIFPDLIKKLDENPEIAVLSPKLVDKDGRLQHSAGSFPNLINLKAWSLFLDDLPVIKKFFPAYHLEDPVFYQKERSFDWVQAACWIMKTSVFKKLGGFDQSIFMYGEDVDFCYRTARAGFKNWYFPQTKVVHLAHGKSSGGYILGEYQGLMHFFRKYHSEWMFLLKLILQVNAFNRMTIFGILLGNGTQKKNYQEALVRLAKL